MMHVGVRGVAFIATILLTTQFIVPVDVLRAEQQSACDKPAVLDAISQEQFFNVELLPNPVGQPFFESSFVEEYRCSTSNEYIENRSEFPKKFQEMLQSAFTPRVSTNMNVIVMGDSLGMQLSILLQGTAADSELSPTNRAVLAKYPKEVGLRDIYSVSKARGNGTIAQWRLFGMLRSEGLSEPLPPFVGGGWRLDMVEQMKAFTWNMTGTTTDPSYSSAAALESFDVMVFRIPQEWIPLSDVNDETLLETVLLAKGLFGVKTIIFVNMPLIKAYTETTELAAANQRVRSFVDNWHKKRASHAIDVFLLELGTLVNEAGVYNARRLGFDTNQTDFIAEHLPNDPLVYSRPMALNCLERPLINETTGTYTGVCPLNMLYFDGLHICMETFGPRIVAGIGCLVDCATQNAESHHACERACNQKHMRLSSVSIR